MEMIFWGVLCVLLVGGVSLGVTLGISVAAKFMKDTFNWGVGCDDEE